MFSTQCIDEFFLEQLRILEKSINRHDVDALVLGIEESKNIEFWSKYFIKENVVTRSAAAATKNQYYCPDFGTKLKSFYLPTVPLWTKLTEEKIKNKYEHLKDLPIRTVYTETNTNAQVEECFKIKKHSSNINQNINLTEFLELNYHDNYGLLLASAKSFIQQVALLKSKDKKKVHKVKSTCENLLSNNTNKVQFKENAATKDEQTPHSDDENMNDSDIEDKRNQCREPS